jgi:hypothetical protein
LAERSRCPEVANGVNPRENEFGDFFAGPDLDWKFAGRGQPATRRVNRENHPSIPLSSLLESVDVVVKDMLVSRTFDLYKSNLTSRWILCFDIESFSNTTQCRDSFPTSSREYKVNQRFKILR